MRTTPLGMRDLEIHVQAPGSPLASAPLPKTARGRGIWGGTVAGVVAGTFLSGYMLVMNLITGQDMWMGAKMAGAPFLGEAAMQPGFAAQPVAVGVLSHFAVSIVWGALFGALVIGRSRPATIAYGALYGVVVWLGMFYAVLPAVGLRAMAQSVPVHLAIIEHVLFGLVLAVAFLPFQPRRVPA